jgi:hypothetical protein
VKLSFAFTTGEAGSITLTPTTAGDFDFVPGDDDGSTPIGGVQSKSEANASADGAIPIRGDGSQLPSHGIYGPGVSFLEFGLGHFTLTDSPIGDYQGTPTSFPRRGQINVYSVTVTGFASGVHIDAYGYTVSGGNDGGEGRVRAVLARRGRAGAFRAAAAARPRSCPRRGAPPLGRRSLSSRPASSPRSRSGSR